MWCSYGISVLGTDTEVLKILTLVQYFQAEDDKGVKMEALQGRHVDNNLILWTDEEIRSHGSDFLKSPFVLRAQARLLFLNAYRNFEIGHLIKYSPFHTFPSAQTSFNRKKKDIFISQNNRYKTEYIS